MKLVHISLACNQQVDYRGTIQRVPSTNYIHCIPFSLLLSFQVLYTFLGKLANVHFEKCMSIIELVIILLLFHTQLIIIYMKL